MDEAETRESGGSDWRRAAADELDRHERRRLERVWDALDPPPAEAPPGHLTASTMERIRARARETPYLPWTSTGWRPLPAVAALLAMLLAGATLGLGLGLRLAPVQGPGQAPGPVPAADEPPAVTTLDVAWSSGGLADTWWNAWSGDDEPAGPGEAERGGGA